MRYWQCGIQGFWILRQRASNQITSASAALIAPILFSLNFSFNHARRCVVLTCNEGFMCQLCAQKIKCVLVLCMSSCQVLNFYSGGKKRLSTSAPNISEAFTVFPRMHCCHISGSDGVQRYAICLYCSEATGNGEPKCVCMDRTLGNMDLVFLNEALSAHLSVCFVKHLFL